jgi:hypothetical protein
VCPCNTTHKTLRVAPPCKTGIVRRWRILVVRNEMPGGEHAKSLSISASARTCDEGEEVVVVGFAALRMCYYGCTWR